MIDLRGAGFSYGGGGGGSLSGIDLSLPAGSFHFLTGPSGAGKTTLLKLCYGELKPTQGQVALLGKDSRMLSRDGLALVRQRIGVVHQDCRFLDHLPVAENVTLPLLVAGRDPAAEADNLRQLMSWVGLTHRADAYPAELSGGERQRAALARAVITDPDVVIADEPTGNVDWEMSQRLMTLLAELNRLGKTILVATHDMALIRAAKPLVQARVLRLADGQLQAAGAEL
ncbi:cell division ATP-binding protein FtsE [Jannaschia formosa]|uniref:cell division ATP-binding protein FtsE n=1 Tax=Jannaschia formosa TaxID=2259592 RepID=UPI000E1C0486|nr:ATP-binding cassette domain-containing protein [Jannaschia formosa]TFL16466.1 ATP-binding cassette domain-containing protein [Jannaschia formosa]